MRKLVVSTKDHLLFILHREIVCCVSDNSYCTICTLDCDAILVSKPLFKLKKQLAGGDFIKVSQSVLVNKNHILKVDKRAKMIFLSGGIQISYSIKLSELIAHFEINEGGILENDHHAQSVNDHMMVHR